MDFIKAFQGIRPVPEKLAEVVAPPYDVITRAAAKAYVVAKPDNFLRISRAEIDCADDVAAESEVVYQQSQQTLKRLLAQKVLKPDEQPTFYLYQIQGADYQQLGILAAVAVSAYQSGYVKKHELTRPKKETDRAKHIACLQGHISPVLLTYRAEQELAELLQQARQTEADAEVIEQAVCHRLWRLSDADLIDRLAQKLNTLPALYVADGHHRTAAAARVAEAGNQAADYFLAALFPDNELTILGYHRLLTHLNNLAVDQFLIQLQQQFTVELCAYPYQPQSKDEIGLYLAGQWYGLTCSERTEKLLPADILAQFILEPLLDIHDVRTDERIDFVGGHGAVAEAVTRVDSEEMQAAFILFPTTLSELLDVADEGGIMPPKSTWFEPKLLDGLVSYLF